MKRPRPVGFFVPSSFKKSGDGQREEKKTYLINL